MTDRPISYSPPMIEALLKDSNRTEHTNWGWPMLDVERLLPPVPARGAQGFWKWRTEV